MSERDQPAGANTLLPLLLRLYVPIMLLGLLIPAVIGGIAVLIIGKWVAAVLLLIVIVGCGAHVGYLILISSKKLKREHDWFEMPLEPEQKVKLREFVIDIARRWDTPRPEEIRLSALSAAHVYETKKGKRVLVIGGMALAALTCEALGAVIAHELTHFEGGDTGFAWENLTGYSMMGRLAFEFRHNLIHYANPAIWPAAAFQFYVEAAHARDSREREFRCDARAARHSGPAATAAALVYIHVVEQMPWANLKDVLSMAAGVGAVSTDVFTEQARRAAAMHPDDWAEATRDEMDKRTGWLDDHPCLRERLDAIGATADEGLDYLLDSQSPPARSLLKDWRAVERKLSVKLTSMYQLWRQERYLLP